MDGAIAEANDAFLRMVGYSQEDLLAGLRWRDMIAPEYIEASNSAIVQLETKGVCQPFENEYIRKDDMVSDIGMPQEDGYTLIRQVRALPKDQGGQIPAVALTAYARAEDRKPCWQAFNSMSPSQLMRAS